MPTTGRWSIGPSGGSRTWAISRSVKILPEPGSAPDRVILNVDVEEQSTGEFSVSGGYSTADGFLGEVSIAERNLLGRGYYGKTSVQYGQYTRGANMSFVDPYFLGYRVALGLDLFYKQQNATSYVSYETKTIRLRRQARVCAARRSRLPGSLFALSPGGLAAAQFDELQQHQSRISSTPSRPRTAVDDAGYSPAPAGYAGIANCYADGEASLAVKRELARGAVLTSLIGYTLSHNTLDNNKSPTQGILAEFRQDFAGVGGDVKFVRTSADLYALSRSRIRCCRLIASPRRAHHGMGRRRPADARSLPDGSATSSAALRRQALVRAT